MSPPSTSPLIGRSLSRCAPWRDMPRVAEAAKAAAKVHARPRLWNAEFCLLMLAGSTYGYAFSTFILLPLFMADSLGEGPLEIGRAAAAFGLSALAITPVIARLVDRVPRRFQFGSGALVMAITAAAFMNVDAYGPLLLALRALQGASFALVLAVLPTLVAETVAPERLAEALGLSGASMLATNAFAPAIGEPLAAEYGWSFVFALAVLSALFAVVVSLFLGEGEPAVCARKERRGGLWSVLGNRYFAIYGLVTFLGAVGFGSLFTFLGPFALDRGFERTSDFFVAYAAAAVAVRVFAGRIPDRFGRRRTALFMLVSYAAVPALAGSATAPLHLAVLGAVFGASHGLLHPSMNAMALARARPVQRGRVMVLFSGAFSAGAWGSGLALGPVAESFGYPAVFAIGVLSVVWAFTVLLTSPTMAAKPGSELAASGALVD